MSFTPKAEMLKSRSVSHTRKKGGVGKKKSSFPSPEVSFCPRSISLSLSKPVNRFLSASKPVAVSQVSGVNDVLYWILYVRMGARSSPIGSHTTVAS